MNKLTKLQENRPPLPKVQLSNNSAWWVTYVEVTDIFSIKLSHRQDGSYSSTSIDMTEQEAKILLDFLKDLLE